MEQTREDIYFEAMVRGEIHEDVYKTVLKGEQVKDFIVGLRVKAINGYDDKIHIGYEGTVCKVHRRYDYIGIRWDKDVRGHDCNGTCDESHGYNVPKKNLTII